MEPAFWHNRWQENKIGFHLEEVNPYLIAHWPQLGLSNATRVLVPLCGKSCDLVWLAQQGMQVVGVELSELAVEAFFTEQGLAYEKQAHALGTVYRAENIQIWCADYFALTAEHIGPVDAVYDRAALIAMPENMRAEYVRQTAALAGQVPQLLITLVYPQQQMTGPPFAVDEQEVAQYYQASYRGAEQPAVSVDVLAEHAHFAQRGLTVLRENIYFLQPIEK